jgi:hypothetical protein
VKDLKIKDPVCEAEKGAEVTYTIDESPNKYKAPEFESPKLKKVKEKFAKDVFIKR